MCEISKNKMILCALYASIALSNWSYYILCELLKLDFYLYEVFFIPIILFNLNKFTGKIKISKGYLAVSFLVIVCFFFGMFKYPQYIMSHITTYRTIFYYVIIICIFKNTTEINLNLFKWICFGSVIGDFLYSLTVNSTSDTSAVNLVALAVLVIIPIIQNKLMETIIFSGLTIVVAFRSSFRISIVLVAAAIMLALLYVVVVQHNIKVMFIAIILGIIMVIFVLNFESFINILVEKTGMNSYAAYRVSVRLKHMIHGNLAGSQDTIRYETFSRVAKEFWNKILPNGVIGKSIGEYGVYKDSPMIFLYDALGSAFSWIIVIYLEIKGIIVAKLALFNKEKKYLGFLAIFTILFLILLLINGTFLLNTYEVCISAVVLGYWLNPNLLRLKTEC